MKTTVIPVLLAAVFAMPAFAEDLQFTLTNNSEYTIDQFYVSLPGVKGWGEDILGKDVLEGGQSANITVSNAEGNCEYDLKAVDEDDEEHVVESFDVCDTPNVSFDK
jgi:hypothetical protein